MDKLWNHLIERKKEKFYCAIFLYPIIRDENNKKNRFVDETDMFYG